MSIKTKHYNLTAFEAGDTYSASADRRRFTIIDNELSFLASQIGDGVIDGWGIAKINSTTIRIGPGMGIIDGFLVVTYGALDLEMPSNRRLYLFMKRNPDFVADLGAFCDLATLAYIDTTVPSQPATPTVTAKPYNLVSFKWIKNPEVDVDHYAIYRNGVHIDDSPSNSYTDNNVVQNTTYIYNVVAIDFNTNASVFSNSLSVTTDNDNRIPTDPIDLDILTGNGTLQIYWGASNFLAGQYTLNIQPITLDGIPDGVSSTITVSNTTFSHIYDGLVNGQTYQITVKAKSHTGVSSPGIVGRGEPIYSSGATELKSLHVDDFAIDSSYRIGLHLSWELTDEEYVFPDYFLVTIYRDGEVGIASIYTDTTNTITRYTISLSNGDLTRDIDEETKYTIRVQTVTNDIKSNGFITKIKTRKFRPPIPISNLAIDAVYNVNNRSVVATWDNSISTFAYNTVTVKKVPLSDTTTFISLLDEANYGQSTNFSVATKDIDNLCRYDISVTAHDLYGNTSEAISASAILNTTFSSTTIGGITIVDSGIRPPTPTEQFLVAGNDQITLSWNKADSDFVDGYKVYRANFASAYQTSDFSLITTTKLPEYIRKFTDYSVDNGSRYVYFVTTVDVFGNESLNPSDDYIFYPLVYGFPRALNSNLSKAPAISVSVSGNDAVISWLGGDDAFDGYEIFRSDGNNYSFKSIGSAGPQYTQFTDHSALKINGTYCYMMRKYRNEAELFTSRSRLAPAGTLSLGLVSRINSSITIDTTDYYSIKLLLGPIRDEVKRQFSVPTHLYFGVGDDRRVRQQNELTVTDWTTTDYQKYTTNFSLISTKDYIVYVDGIQSAYSTIIDRDNRVITFEQPIFDNNINDGKAIADQTPPPFVTVIFTDVGEVTGLLPQENIEELSASKITKGKILAESMPQIDHLGRTLEPCIPTRASLSVVSPQLYAGTTPIGVTFYDVVKTTDNRILAATSGGVLLSSSNGNQWVNVLKNDSAASRVIYSDFLGLYAVVMGKTVYISYDLEQWLVPSGMDGATFVRDIAADRKGSIYATADSGVYKFSPLNFTKLFWSQLNALVSSDTNAYGIAHDVISDVLLVGGSNGLYASVDDGISWDREDNFVVNAIVHSICIVDLTIFLVSSNKVWRNGISDTTFIDIGDFPSQCRRGLLFANDFYVTTDHGLFRSSSINVFHDTNFKWEIAFENLNRNGFVPATHALRILDDNLWMGQDERLYSATMKRKVSTHADLASVCPTVFVDGVERSVGVYYTQSNNVAFDTRIASDSVVEIVNQYSDFDPFNNGWADTKYDAEVLININDVPVIGPPVTKLINGRFWSFTPKPWTVANDPKSVAAAVSLIETPFFNGRTSNFDRAQSSLTTIVQISDAITTLDFLGQATSIPSDTIARLMIELEKFKTYIHPDLRNLVKYPKFTGVISYNGFDATFDVVSGHIVITGGVDKYTRVSISLKGVSLSNIGELSHEDIEDVFEKWNSGLSASMALVQQSNIIKTGIYHRLLGKQQGANYTPEFNYQSVFNVACDDWYNKLISSVDYTQQLEQLPTVIGNGVEEITGFSLDYPADVLYIQSVGEIWICGQGGIMAINKTTLDTRKTYSTPFYVYNMSLSEGIVTFLAEDGVYTITLNNGIAIKTADITPPQNFTSIFVSGNTIYIGTQLGVFSKRPFESNWTKVFSLTNAVVRSSPRLTFAVGKNPDSIADSLVYYSFSGVIWNRSSAFIGIEVNSVSQRYDSIYYATNSGLFVEDLSGLFQNNNFSGPSLGATILDPNLDNTIIKVNDVDADDSRVVAGTSSGAWYSMSGGTVDGSGQSRLGTIHKVKIIDGRYWLFANNLIEIENVNRLVQLSTGKVLL